MEDSKNRSGDLSHRELATCLHLGWPGPLPEQNGPHLRFRIAGYVVEVKDCRGPSGAAPARVYYARSSEQRKAGLKAAGEGHVRAVTAPSPLDTFQYVCRGLSRRSVLRDLFQTDLLAHLRWVVTKESLWYVQRLLTSLYSMILYGISRIFLVLGQQFATVLIGQDMSVFHDFLQDHEW